MWKRFSGSRELDQDAVEAQPEAPGAVLNSRTSCAQG